METTERNGVEISFTLIIIHIYLEACSFILFNSVNYYIIIQICIKKLKILIISIIKIIYNFCSFAVLTIIIKFY